MDSTVFHTRFGGVVKLFSVDFYAIDTNNILDIYKYSMRRTRCKILFRLIKKIFIIYCIIDWSS